MKRGVILRPSWLWLLLFVLLACSDVWLWSRLAAAQRRLARTEQDVARSIQLAGQIESLKQKPNLVKAQEVQTSELSAWIEKTVASAGIPVSHLIRITPEPARRIGDSSYMEKATQLQVRSVNLKQLLLFLQGLSSDGSGLRAKSVRLTAPREQETGSEWNVETTICYLIYLPRNSAESGRSQP